MANENTNNLIPLNERTKEEQREIARQGGIASGKARREKQKTQQILADLVSIKNKDLAMFNKLATKLGLDGDISIHEVFTLTCLLNSVKNGNLGDLERLSKLLGEDNAKEHNNGILDELTEYLKGDK
jgi:hypothetical protein